MKMGFVENTKRNVYIGVISRIIVVICPFITRTIMQYILGAEYLGLGSLFTSILSVLKLAEMGVGTAIVYSMYKPVAENDIKKVNALLNFYKKAYTFIGIVILTIGLLLIPFLPKFIVGECPNGVNVVYLYLIYLGDTAISYFLFSYMNSLLIVYQRSDVNSSTNMIITIFLNVTQAIVLVWTRNYTLFILVLPIFTILNNLRIAYLVKKMFPQYRCEGDISQQEFRVLQKQVVGTFVAKLSEVARNAFDSICISSFLGLTMTAKYNNYYYIISAVGGFMAIFSSALTGGVGNHVVIKTKENNFAELKEIDCDYMIISGWCTIYLLCLFQPFMRIWMGREMCLPNIIVYSLCAYFYLLRINEMRAIYTTVNGLWWEHRIRSIVEAVMNIFLNIILAKLFGVYGIVFATILTIFFINTIWGAGITFKHYFGGENIRKYFGYHIRYGLINLMLCIITLKICEFFAVFGGVLNLLINILICTIVPALLYYLIYRKNEYFLRFLGLIMSMIKEKKC